MNKYEMNFKEFSSYVKNIKFGFIDQNNKVHLDTFANPTNFYKLQTPEQLLESNVGLCFDIVELYRKYLTDHSIACESYFIEYKTDNVLECHAFIIEQGSNKLWYECIDNSWVNEINPRGYYDKELLIKNIYEWFQTYIISEYGEVNKSNFYLNKYEYPSVCYNEGVSLEKYCTTRNYLSTARTEYSGMSIVFCKGKVLVLETRHNEFVFPKGHIESGETSKDASIRECLEESGVKISNAKYYGECGSYSYTFTAGHLKIANDDYYKTFGVNSITKNIYVHVFEINDFQSFSIESIFIKGLWVDMDAINTTISHENTRKIFKEALKLYKLNHK